MKINTDLVDAVMMLSFIILVLVGTTDFDSETTKSMLMGGLGLLTVVMVILRVFSFKQKKNEHEISE